MQRFENTAAEEAQKINRQTGVSFNTDQKYWESIGIKTGEDLARLVMAQTYSDAYKELHGVRPRLKPGLSIDDYRHMLDSLVPEQERDFEEEIEIDVDEFPSMPKRSGMGRRVSESQLRKAINQSLARLVVESPIAAAVASGSRKSKGTTTQKKSKRKTWNMNNKQRNALEKKVLSSLVASGLKLDGIDAKDAHTGLLASLDDNELKALKDKIENPTFIQGILRSLGNRNVKRK